MKKPKSSKHKLKEDKLKKGLKRLIDHWEKFLAAKKGRKNKEYLLQIARDIKELEKESSLSLEMPDLYPASYLIHHFLISPYGSAYMTNRSLLDAALDFSEAGGEETSLLSEKAKESDLSHLLEEPKEDLPMIFWSLYEIIKKEKT